MKESHEHEYTVYEGIVRFLERDPDKRINRLIHGGKEKGYFTNSRIDDQNLEGKEIKVFHNQFNNDDIFPDALKGLNEIADIGILCDLPFPGSKEIPDTNKMSIVLLGGGRYGCSPSEELLDKDDKIKVFGTFKGLCFLVLKSFADEKMDQCPDREIDSDGEFTSLIIKPKALIDCWQKAIDEYIAEAGSDKDKIVIGYEEHFSCDVKHMYYFDNVVLKIDKKVINCP